MSPGSTVTVISPVSNSILRKIKVGFEPTGLTFSSLTGATFVANRLSNTLSRIPKSGIKTDATIMVGAEPRGVAFDSANGNIYATNFDSGTVSVISGAKNKIVKTITVKQNPMGIVFDSLNDNLYVACGGSGNLGSDQGFTSGAGFVSVINGATNKVVATISVGTAPYDLVFDRDNGLIFVSNHFSNPGTVSVINGSTNTLFATVTVGGAFSEPEGIAYDSANGDIYVANWASGTVFVFNATTPFGGVTTISGFSEPTGVMFDSVNGLVYVANSAALSVSVIAGNNNSVVKTIPSVGFELGPYEFALNPSSNKIYVTADSLSVIDGASNNVTSTISVGDFPVGVSFDSLNGMLYVDNFFSGTISIIS